MELAGGRKVSIVRNGWSDDDRYQVSVQDKGGVAYIRIPSFSDPKLEQAAIDAVKKFGNTRAMVIDVRGDTGGTTPEELLGKLMNRRFRWWSGHPGT